MSSLRAHMTLTLVGVITLLASASAVLFYVVVERSVRTSFDAELVEEARTYAAMMEYDAEDGFEFELEDAIPQLTASTGTSLQLGIWRARGDAVLSSAKLERYRERAWSARLETPVVFDLSASDDEPARGVAFTFEARVDDEAGADVRPPGELVLVLARGTGGMEGMLGALYLWFWTLGLLGIAGSSIVAFEVVRRGLRPLDRVAAEVARIDDRHLSRRLDGARLPSEVQPLVQRVNSLLDGLEQAFARERQFTADAAHELRTPLSVLRTTAELALQRERSGAEYREALTETLTAALSMQRLVENLLLMARAEAGAVPLEITRVALRDLVDHAWAPFAAQAAARGLEFRNEIDVGARVDADREKLQVVLSNLLSNAASYTEEGGWVVARARVEAGLVLEIGDSGPPLTTQQRERMFDRLWRSDPARASDGAHCGIGLSVARALCDAMGYAIAAHVDGAALYVRVRDAAS